ncbi:MAG: oligosaccharide flippase family protein [Terriglobia bacterium]
MACRNSGFHIPHLLEAGELRRTLKRLTPRFLDGLWTRLESSPVGQRLLRGTFWSMMGTMASRSMALAAAIVAARILGKMVYGELGIIQSTVGMLGTLAGFGMSTTASKFVAELRAKDPARAGRIIALSGLLSWGISLALAGLLLLVAPWLCQHTLAAPRLTGYLRLSAPLLVLGGINGAQLGVLSGFEAFKSVAGVTSLRGLLNFPLIVGGALLFGLGGIICGMVFAQAGEFLMGFFALRRVAMRHGIAPSYSSCMAELPIIWQFSIPAVGAEILMSVVGWAAATLLVRQPNGYSEMGAFSAANQWFKAVMWLPFMFSGVALPVLAERLGAGDRVNASKLLKMSLKVNALTVLPLIVAGCILSPYIMSSYGRGFESAWPTLIVVLVTAGLLSFELTVGQLIAASGRMWLGFSANIGWGLVFLVTVPVLLKLGWGAFGLASARLLAYSAHAIFCGAYAVVFIVAVRRNAGVGEPIGAPALRPRVSGTDIAG